MNRHVYLLIRSTTNPFVPHSHLLAFHSQTQFTTIHYPPTHLPPHTTIHYPPPTTSHPPTYLPTTTHPPTYLPPPTHLPTTTHPSTTTHPPTTTLHHPPTYHHPSSPIHLPPPCTTHPPIQLPIHQFTHQFTRQVACLLRHSTSEDHLFLLHHTLRLPHKHLPFATSFVQPPGEEEELGVRS